MQNLIDRHRYLYAALACIAGSEMLRHTTTEVLPNSQPASDPLVAKSRQRVLRHLTFDSQIPSCHPAQTMFALLRAHFHNFVERWDFVLLIQFRRARSPFKRSFLSSLCLPKLSWSVRNILLVSHPPPRGFTDHVLIPEVSSLPLNILYPRLLLKILAFVISQASLYSYFTCPVQVTCIDSHR